MEKLKRIYAAVKHYHGCDRALKEVMNGVVQYVELLSFNKIKYETYLL